MYFEVLIKCAWDKELSYKYYYIVKSEDQDKAIKKVSKFISTYFINDTVGTLLVDHDNIAYEFSDGEIVELVSIQETTAEKFLEEQVSDLFLIT